MRTMTLSEAIAFARVNQPAVRAARARLVAIRADLEVPRAEWVPSVGAFAEVVGSTVNNSTANMISNAAVDLPRIGATRVGRSPDLQPYPTTAIAIGARQQLFDFGRTAAQEATITALAAAEEASVRLALLETSFAVTQAFFGVRASHAVLDVATQAEQRSGLHRDFARAAVSKGLRSPIEQTRAEADLTRFTVARVRAEGGLRLARGVFAATLGWAGGELEAADQGEAADAHGDEPSMPTEEEVVRRATLSDPAIFEATKRADAQHAQTNAIAATMRPYVFATASVSARAGGGPPSSGTAAALDGWAPEVPNYSAGIVVTWPIFEATVRARVAAATAREGVARSEVDIARQRAAAIALQVYGSAKIAAESLGALQVAADAARANHAQAEARFNAGLGTSTELADAETLRTEAEIQLAIGHYQLATARAAVGRALAEDQ